MSTFDQRLREAYDYGVATAHTTPACRDYLFDQWRERLAGLDPLDAIPTPPAGFEVTEDGTVVDRRPELRLIDKMPKVPSPPITYAHEQRLRSLGLLHPARDPSVSWIP